MSFFSIIIRCVYFVTTALLWYFSLWFLAVPFLVWYIYRCRAYELVVLGLLFDMQFVTSGSIPYYTIFFTLMVIVAEWIKPQLRARVEYYEMV